MEWKEKALKTLQDSLIPVPAELNVTYITLLWIVLICKEDSVRYIITT